MNNLNDIIYYIFTFSYRKAWIWTRVPTKLCSAWPLLTKARRAASATSTDGDGTTKLLFRTLTVQSPSRTFSVTSCQSWEKTGRNRGWRSCLPKSRTTDTSCCTCRPELSVKRASRGSTWRAFARATSRCPRARCSWTRPAWFPHFTGRWSRRNPRNSRSRVSATFKPCSPRTRSLSTQDMATESTWVFLLFFF